MLCEDFLYRVPDSTLEEVRTDLRPDSCVGFQKTPPLEYSMEPSEEQPYSEYISTDYSGRI